MKRLTDSFGRLLDASVEGRAAFWRWYSESKLRDEKRRPLLLFHGTALDFREFQRTEGWYGCGIYLTSQPEVASRYADERAEADDSTGALVIPVYARMTRPYEFHVQVDGTSSIEQLLRKLHFANRQIDRAMERGEAGELARQCLEERGYDGLIASDPLEGAEYLVFDPEQVKSAIGNSGAWDGDSPDLCDMADDIDLELEQERDLEAPRV